VPHLAAMNTAAAKSHLVKMMTRNPLGDGAQAVIRKNRLFMDENPDGSEHRLDQRQAEHLSMHGRCCDGRHTGRRENCYVKLGIGGLKQIEESSRCPRSTSKKGRQTHIVDQTIEAPSLTSFRLERGIP